MRIRGGLIGVLVIAATARRLRPGPARARQPVRRRRRGHAEPDPDPDARRAHPDPVVRPADADPAAELLRVHGRVRRQPREDRQALRDDRQEHRLLEPDDLSVARPGLRQVPAELHQGRLEAPADPEHRGRPGEPAGRVARPELGQRADRRADRRLRRGCRARDCAPDEPVDGPSDPPTDSVD